MKKATLTHIYEEPNDQTIGLLRVDGDADAVWIMEPGINDPVSPRIDDGTYLAKWMHSPTYGWTWSLIGADVSEEPEPWASRSQIRVHPGNDDEETLGCWLPGLSITWDPRDQEPQVSRSRDAFAKMKMMIGEEDFIVEVKSGILTDVS